MDENKEELSTETVEKKEEVKESTEVTKKSLIPWFLRGFILLSGIYCVYAKVITKLAEKYPKTTLLDNEKTFCKYISQNARGDLGGMLLEGFVLLHIVLLIYCIKNRKKKPYSILKVIGSGIACSIIIFIGMWDSIQCSINQTWKPILYIYPEETMQVEVKLDREDLLKTSYPKYNDGWKVTAEKDGSLYDEDKKFYYALYWDEYTSSKCEFEDGFYVTKENAISFLEEKLTYIGLNDKERNEFIMYWLPILEDNEKSIVQFDLTEELEENEKLLLNPTPDTLLRVHINIKKVNHKVNIKEQILTPTKRKGYTIVEWGGTLYK